MKLFSKVSSRIRSFFFQLKFHNRTLRVGPKFTINAYGHYDMKLGTNVSLGERWTLLLPTVIDFHENSRLCLEDNVSVGFGSKIVLGVNAEMKMGKNSRINEKCVIRCEDRLIIGEDTAISWNVTIMDTDRHFVVREGEKQSKTKPVVIGDRCWIGCNTTILKGVVLGDCCIVGAGSVVTKSFPSNSLIAGNPAKLIRSNIDWKL